MGRLSSVGIWYAFERLSGAAVSAIAATFLARLFNPSELGQYFFISSVVMITLTVLQLGVKEQVVIEFSTGRMCKRYFSKLVRFFLLSHVAVGLIFLAYSISGESSIDIYLILTCFIILIIGFSFFFEAFAVGVKDPIAISRARIFSKVLFIITAFLLAVLNIKNGMQYFVFVVEPLIFALLLFMAYRSNILDYEERLPQENTKYSTLFKKSFPTLINNLLIILYVRSDAVIINHFVGLSEGGYYYVSIRIVEFFYVFAPFFSTVLMPHVFSLDDEAKRFGAFWALSLVSLALAGILFLIGVFAGGALISNFYPPEYDVSREIFYVLIAMVPAVYLGSVATQYLIFLNVGRKLWFGPFMGLSVNIVGSVSLAPSFGAIGVAVFSVLSFYIAAGYQVFLVYKLGSQVFCADGVCSSHKHFGDVLEGFKSLHAEVSFRRSVR